MNLTLVIVLIVVGILLMLAELFLLPGISIAGVAGIIAFIAAVYFAYVTISPVAGHIVMFVSLFMLCISVYMFVKFKTLDRMALDTRIDSKIDLLKDANIKIGDQGITVSRLAPMGKVKVNGLTAEAKSFGEFIDEETEITVIDIKGNTLIVVIEIV